MVPVERLRRRCADWIDEEKTRQAIVPPADDADLGSTVGVSCDMRHPNAANTHPELGHTVLLRDMIDWCIQHPVRGPKLAENDPELRALEADILAQRKGTPLDCGRR